MPSAPTPPLAGDGGYPFVVDPRLSAIEVRVFWLPTETPFTVLLSPAPPELAGAPTPALDATGRFAPYVAIGAPGRDHPIILLGDDESAPLAATIPLDADLPQRLDALARLWRRLTLRRAEPPGTLTLQRRTRLVETLRALDGHLDAATTREVAAGLFGEDRIPAGPEWKVHDLRSRAKRLISAGRALMNGGYRKLLRPPP